MENIIVKYSELFEDDGGMNKLVSDFTKTGEQLVAEARRIKKEFNDSFTLENPEVVAKYEAQVTKLTKVNEAYEQAKKDLIAIEKAYTEALNKTTQSEIQSERAKQEKLKTLKAEINAEAELSKGIIAENNAQKSQIALSEAQRRQREIAEKAIIKEKDAYAQMSAELNKLFRASASVAVEMYRLEEAGQKNTPAYARLASEFGVLQGRTVKLDKALKDIDKSLGRNQRNVGNYQFDALGNSIQQILREAPSAAVSLNTFFLAISNNLPGFFDAMKDAGIEIKQLQDIVKEASAELVAQQAIQAESKAISEEATAALDGQVESVIESVAASHEQATAIREQVSAHVAEIETTGSATTATIANTETVLANAGATTDQIAVIQRQVAVTGEAVAATTAATSAENSLTAAVARANATLTAQPTLLQRVSSSLFSLNTFFTLGVLALTLWGGKLVEAAKNLFDFGEELESVKKSQEELSKAQLNGLKATVADSRELRSNLAIARDKNLLDEERMIALKALRAQYPFYFKNLTDEEILLGRTAKAENEIIKALNKRAEAEKANDQIVKNRQRQLELADEQAKKEAQLLQAQAEYRKLATQTVAPSQAENAVERELTALGKVRNLEGEIQKIKTETSKLDKQNLSYEGKILQFEKDSVGLRYKQEKAQREKLSKQIKTVDYLASEYELMKTILDNAIQNNREIYESDKYTLEERLAAREKFLDQSKTLSELEYKETLRTLERTYDEERKATIRSADGLTQISKYTQNGLAELKKQYDFDTQKATKDHEQRLLNIEKESGEVSKLQQLQMQLQKLEYDRQYFSKSSQMFQAYTKEISLLQNEINKIINPFEGFQLSDAISISESELTQVKELRAELSKILNGRSLSELNPAERKSVLKQIEAFEKERAEIEGNYDVTRKQRRVKQIEEEQKQFAETTNEFKQLELERQSILLDIENKGIDDMLKAQKEKAEAFKTFMEDINKIVGLVLDKMIELTQRRIEQSERAIDKQSERVDDQVQRAQNGLKNTLAFEQEELAKREAELIKQQKREQRLQKIKSLYSAYAGYADKDPDTAIAKALRDFAVLEAVTASFGEGGIVEDRLPSDGIFRGPSHRSRSRGIPIMVEGKEGILSTREMANMGKDNFYRMKELAGMGKIDENFFTKQRQSFVQTVGVPVQNEAIITELQELRREMANKPVSNWKVAEVAEGTMKLVEEVIEGKKTKRNHYVIKKPRP
jgi:hypothetical protein